MGIKSAAPSSAFLQAVHSVLPPPPLCTSIRIAPPFCPLHTRRRMISQDNRAISYKFDIQSCCRVGIYQARRVNLAIEMVKKVVVIGSCMILEMHDSLENFSAQRAT
jgi:hypothetical protein